MKACTLFALVGSVLALLDSIRWLIVSIVGYDKLWDMGYIQIDRFASNAFSIIASVSLIVFFSALFVRQK